MTNPEKRSVFSSIGQALKHLFNLGSNLIDRLLYSKRFLALVSLAIAILIFVSVMYSESLASQITQSTELNAQVEVVGDLDEYEISNVPTSVNVVVTGSAVDVRSAQNQNNYKAVLDITSLGEGNHRVRLDRKGFSPTLKVIFQPESVYVSISRKVSQEFTVEPDYLNNEKLEAQYILSDTVLENDTVTINTSQEKMSRISSVKALINVGGKTENFSETAKVVAYDQEGYAMDVDIEPDVINVNVTISSPNREVPIVTQSVGTIPNNKAIESISLDQPTVTIYGPEDVLNGIANVVVPINNQTLSNEVTELKQTLVRPEGVRSMDVESVTITIQLGDKVTREIEKSQIFYENNVNSYNVTKADGSQMVADVILSGTQSRLDKIEPSQIKVYLDMTSLRPGQQVVTLNITGPDQLVKYELLNNDIEVIITQKGE